MKRFRTSRCPPEAGNAGSFRPSRREALVAAGVLAAAPASAAPQAGHPLWPLKGPPILRGAVIAQRRRRESVDGPAGGFGGSEAALPAYGRADFDALARAGANLVVMSFPELWTAEPPYRRDAAMVDLLGRQLDAARSAGLYAVVALRSGPGRSDFIFHREAAGSWFPETMIIDRIWTSREAQSAWGDMCADISGLIANRTELAGLTLMVEPDPNVSGVDQTGQRMDLHDPGAYARRVGPLSNWKRIAADCAKAARGAAPDLPLLVSPPGFARAEYLKGMGPPPVSGCVWCVHDYTPWDYTHLPRNKRAAAGSGHPPWSEFGDLIDAAGPRTAPVFLGEFGAARWASRVREFERQLIGQCEQRGINWAAFRWPTRDQAYEEKDDMFNVLWGGKCQTLCSGRRRCDRRAETGMDPKLPAAQLAELQQAKPQRQNQRRRRAAHAEAFLQQEPAQQRAEDHRRLPHRRNVGDRRNGKAVERRAEGQHRQGARAKTISQIGAQHPEILAPSCHQPSPC